MINPELGPNVEEIILREEGLQIIRPEKFELPEHLNLQSLSDLGIAEEEAGQLVSDIVEYLNSPIIIDKFNTDHTARREWRRQVEAKYGEEGLSFLYSNKLRINKISAFLPFFAKIELRSRNQPPEKTEKIKQLRAEYSQIISGYPEMDIKQKEEVVQRIEQWLKKILDLFSG